VIGPDGKVIVHDIPVTRRQWRIEHIGIARRPGGPSAEFMRRREGELARIVAARSRRTDAQGWRHSFIWPARGRISGRFGSQRVYRGEPGSYHSGVDVAAGAGAPVVAPADGIVVLAADAPFSLEGNLLIIDHGTASTAPSCTSTASKSVKANRCGRATVSARSVRPAARRGRTSIGPRLQRCPARSRARRRPDGLGVVEIHRELMTAEQR